MFKRGVLALLVVFGVAFPLHAASLSITNLYIQPTSTFYVSDLETQEGIVRYTIQNLTTEDISIIIEIDISGPSGVVVKTRTSVEVIVPASGSKEFTNLSFSKEQLNFLDYDQDLKLTIAQTNRIPAGDYAYTLRAYVSGRYSDIDRASDVITITNPNPPTLISPASQAEFTSAQTTGLTFSWQEPNVRADVTVYYTVSIAEVASGQSGESAINSPIFERSELTGSSFVYPSDAKSFEPGRKYVWRVTAIDEAGLPVGDNQGRSGLEYFSFQDYAPPELYDVNSSFPITLSWAASFGSKRYVIEMGINESFSDRTTFETDKTTYTLSESEIEMAYDVRYYWRVQAYDEENNKIGNISQTSSFKTPSFDESPQLTNPAEGAIPDLTPYFYWNSVKDAEKYRIEFSTDQNFQNKWSFQTESDNVNFYYDASISPSLTYGTRHFWRVHALKGGNDWGTMSSTGYFDTPQEFGSSTSTIPPVQLLNPVAIRIPHLEPDFRWTAYEQAEKYSIEFATDINFRDSWVFETDSNDTQFAYTAALSPKFVMNRRYYWRVRGYKNNQAIAESLSATVYFETPSSESSSGGLMLLNPVETEVSSLTPFFSWSSHSEADKYLIEFSRYQSFRDSWKYFTSDETANFAYNSGLSPLLAHDKQYFWRVTPYKLSSPVGDRSAATYFKIAPFSGSPSLIQPVETQVSSLAPFFQWTEVSETNVYFIQFSTRFDFSDAWGTKVSGTSYTYESKALSKDNQYYWRVYAMDSDGRRWGQYSFSTYFLSPSDQKVEAIDVLTLTEEPYTDTNIPQQEEVIAAVEEVIRSLDWNQAKTDPSILSDFDPSSLDLSSMNMSDLKNIDLSQISGPYASKWQEVLNQIKEQVVDFSQLNLNQIKNDVSQLASINPAHIDLSTIDLNALKDIDLASIGGEFASQWKSIAENLDSIDLGQVQGPDLQNALRNIFSGGSAGPGLSRGERKVATGPGSVKAGHRKSNVNLSGKAKFQRVLQATLKAKGYGAQHYRVMEIKVDGKVTLSDELEEKIKKGTIKIEINE